MTVPPIFLIVDVRSPLDLLVLPAMKNFIPASGLSPSGAELTSPLPAASVSAGKTLCREINLYFFLECNVWKSIDAMNNFEVQWRNKRDQTYGSILTEAPRREILLGLWRVYVWEFVWPPCTLSTGSRCRCICIRFHCKFRKHVHSLQYKTDFRVQISCTCLLTIYLYLNWPLHSSHGCKAPNAILSATVSNSWDTNIYRTCIRNKKICIISLCFKSVVEEYLAFPWW